MLIDVHCHLDHQLYKDDLDKVIENARQAGVVKIITAGINSATNKIALSLAKKYDIVEAALGRYPLDALEKEGYFEDKKDQNNKENLKTTVDHDIEFMRKHKDEFIGVGEVGLDLFNGKDIQTQSIEFRKMIELTIELGKPLVIHSRKAEKEALDVLEEFDHLDSDKVVLHCFSGKKGLIRKAIELGYNFSIPANIVRAENFQQLVEKCPLKQLLTETDSPLLSPYRNTDGGFNRNEPKNVIETVKMIAKIKGITEAECAKQIYMNYQRVFELK